MRELRQTGPRGTCWAIVKQAAKQVPSGPAVGHTDFTDSPETATQSPYHRFLDFPCIALLPLVFDFELLLLPFISIFHPPPVFPGTSTIMAGTPLAMRLMASRSTMQLSSMSRRSIATSQAFRAEPLRPNFQSISRVARRGYADAAPLPSPSPSPAAPSPSPAPKPKKRFRFLRWAWRLTWLSGLGLTGTMVYSIYSLRHPEEQIEPDPEKKTLVILGMISSRPVAGLSVQTGALLILSPL